MLVLWDESGRNREGERTGTFVSSKGGVTAEFGLTVAVVVVVDAVWSSIRLLLYISVNRMVGLTPVTSVPSAAFNGSVYFKICIPEDQNLQLRLLTER